MPTRRISEKGGRGNPRRRAARGSAFIEMFFAMPFLLFMMILGMNFCKAYLAQQRAMVAARYLAWSDVQHQPAPTNEEISRKFFFGEPVTSGLASVTAAQAGWFSGTMSQASGTKQYQVQYQYRPIYGGASRVTGKNMGLFPAVRIHGSISVDSGDWRYPDFSFKTLLGDLWNMVTNLF